ncbi:MAG: 2-dehydropantoate 2-reductase [Syntrophaceae bacterium PtaU1.Bin231]|nr:MAG: 2-dehydropantoate 2-reductase [Syntrophaceae bacterium PtaU1.Bin231]
MRMAIMGTGSLGTIIAALTTRGGYPIDCIDANVEHVKALNAGGARVVGLMDLVQPVRALTPGEMVGEYDLILYLAKTTDNESALPVIVKHLKRDGAVVCMQNGIPEDAVADVVGRFRTIGCIVGWGATYLEPGVSRLTSAPEKMEYVMGELDGQDTSRLHEIAKVLSAAGAAKTTTNLIGIRWNKLMSNTGFSGMSAVVAGTYGDVLDQPKALACAQHIFREALAICRAAGVVIEPRGGFDNRDFDFHTEKERVEKIPLYLKKMEPHRNIRTGMLYDIEAGRKPEYEAFNGTITRWGKKWKVPTPVNDQVVDIVRGMWEGRLKIDPKNLGLMELPPLPSE